MTHLIVSVEDPRIEERSSEEKARVVVVPEGIVAGTATLVEAPFHGSNSTKHLS